MEMWKNSTVKVTFIQNIHKVVPVQLSPEFDPSIHLNRYLTSSFAPIRVSMAIRGCHQTVSVDVNRDKLLAKTTYTALFVGEDSLDYQDIYSSSINT